MGPDFSRPRDAFVFTQLANGRVLSACFPGRDVTEIDLICHIGEGFPAMCIVHGIEDRMVPIFLSRELVKVLREKEVECEMVDVPGEDHTFAMGMEVGSRTWEVHRSGFDCLTFWRGLLVGFDLCQIGIGIKRVRCCIVLNDVPACQLHASNIRINECRGHRPGNQKLRPCDHVYTVYTQSISMLNRGTQITNHRSLP